MAGSIQASQGDPEHLIDLTNIRWLLENAIVLDPSWEKGSLYAAMMSVYLNDLSGDQDSERKALEYFELADRAANGYNISIYVTLAESFAVSKQDKSYFLELIDKALTIDISKDKDMKQANTLSKLRAKWLLTRVDELFYM
jgi:homoserine acetyltransferase